MPRTNENMSSGSTQRKHLSPPPPPYTEFAPGPSSSSSDPFPASGHSSRPPPNTQQPLPVQMPMPVPHTAQHPGYGPTPLATNQPLLPYAYYAPREFADVRARWRFFEALTLAIIIWILCGFMVGVEVWGEEGWDWNSWQGLDGAVRFWLKFKVSNGAVE